MSLYYRAVNANVSEKTVLLYLTAILGGVLVFVYTSFRVHHLWQQEP